MQGDPQAVHSVVSRGREFEELIVGREAYAGAPVAQLGRTAFLFRAA